MRDLHNCAGKSVNKTTLLVISRVRNYVAMKNSSGNFFLSVFFFLSAAGYCKLDGMLSDVAEACSSQNFANSAANLPPTKPA